MKSIFTFLMCCFTATVALCQHAYMEQALLDRLAEADRAYLLPVLVLMEDAVNASILKDSMQQAAVPVNEWPRIVAQALQAKAAHTQRPVMNFIEASGENFDGLKPLWIVNAISLNASKTLVEKLAGLPEVAFIGLNHEVEAQVDHFKGVGSAAKSAGGAEPGLKAINAHELWQMGYTGHGRLSLVFDTGVSPDHPSLQSRFLGNTMPLQQTWYGWFSPIPIDKPSQHGTHVSGTMHGLDPAEADTIGVAFGASFIASDFVRDFGMPQSPWTYVDVFISFEWALNPDGDINTTNDVPDVINNSWSGGAPSETHPDCSPIISDYFDAVAAAGIANVLAAGNDGPGPATIPSPSNTNVGLVNAFNVGAVNANTPNFPIAPFSSRGPSQCEAEGSLAIKPEVSAPGVNVRSAFGADSYEIFSGTSMASPHAAGAILLLKEAFPFLSGEELLLALYHSAVDLGEPGEDNSYGRGMIDVKAAFDALAEIHTQVPPATNVLDLALIALQPDIHALQCTNPEGNLVATGFTVRNDGPTAIQGFSMAYTLNGGPVATAAYPEVFLASGDTFSGALPSIAVDQAGNQELHVFIEPLSDEYDLFNNHRVARWRQLTSLASSSSFFADDFESGLDMWNIVNPDYNVGWDTAYTVQIDGTMGYVARMALAEYDNWDQTDQLITPGWWNGQQTFNLNFDYFYRKQSSSSSTQDTLKLYLISACGSVNHLIWKKGGSQLWSNPINSFDAMPENADDWESVSIDILLSDFPDADFSEGVHFKFETVNRRGNNLLLDNVQIDQALSVTRSIQRISAVVVPNPTSNEFRMDWSGAGAQAILLMYSLDGRTVKQQPNYTRNTPIATNDLPGGVYLVEVQWPDGKYSLSKMVRF